MNNQPKVSVIIPVYNIEEYIGRCIESILNQSFTDFELILINDGSNDNSGKICDKYANTDSRIKVIHNINKGVSASRNDGIKNATGEWICFVDGDDWIEEHTLLTLFRYNIKADIIQFKYNIIGAQSDFNEESILQVKLLTQQNYTNCKYFHPACWGYIFNLEIIRANNIYFLETIRIGEDQAFVLKYIAICTSVLLSPLRGYNYLIRNGSAMNSKPSIDKALDHLKAVEDVCNFLKKHNLFGLTDSELYKNAFSSLLISFWTYAWAYSGNIENIFKFNHIYNLFLKNTKLPLPTVKLKLCKYKIINFLHCVKTRYSTIDYNHKYQ